jgi:hypothetical protein
MNILKKAYLLFVFFIFTITSVNALVLEWDINLENATSDSLEISWPAVDGALGYFVYYDTESHDDDKNYTNTSDDMIETTNYTIKDLQANTNYYVALKVVDWDGNEWDFSNEYKFTTSWQSIENSLSIENIEVIDSNTISVKFNVDIDSTKDYEFKIEEKDNNLNELTINSVNIEWNYVNLVLGTSLESNKDYTLTVVSLTGINWETIEEWVDWVIDFTTWEIVDLNSAGGVTTDENWNTEVASEDTEIVTDENWNTEITSGNTEITIGDAQKSDKNESIDLNSAAPKSNDTTLSWTNLSEEDIKKTAELAAAKSKKLPQTGPTEWLLFIAALILAFWITKFRKQA